MRALLLSLILASPVMAQPASAPASPLGVISRLVGEWEGDAWMMRREGRVSVRQKEWVTLEAGGTLAVIRGLGTLGADTVHQAFAVVHPNHERTGHMMRAFTAEGHWLDPEIEITATKATWRMTDPRIGNIRYEISIDEQGRWIENGFFSRDNGATWTPFLGMTLTKKR
jgi:hypothetical protein